MKVIIYSFCLLFVIFSCQKERREFEEQFEQFYGEYHYSYSEFDDINYVSTNEIDVNFGILIKNKKLYFYRDGRLVRRYKYYSYSYVSPETNYSKRTLQFKNRKSVFSVTFDLVNYQNNKILVTSEDPVQGGTNFFIKKQ